MQPINKCPRCGAPFYCSKSPKCWCFDYDVPPDKREMIEEEFEGCLCPACLKEFSDS